MAINLRVFHFNVWFFISYGVNSILVLFTKLGVFSFKVGYEQAVAQPIVLSFGKPTRLEYIVPSARRAAFLLYVEISVRRVFCVEISAHRDPCSKRFLPAEISVHRDLCQ